MCNTPCISHESIVSLPLFHKLIANCTTLYGSIWDVFVKAAAVACLMGMLMNLFHIFNVEQEPDARRSQKKTHSKSLLVAMRVGYVLLNSCQVCGCFWCLFYVCCIINGSMFFLFFFYHCLVGWKKYVCNVWDLWTGSSVFWLPCKVTYLRESLSHHGWFM